MIRPWAVFALLLLGACAVEVDDIRSYWNKAIIDHSLSGTWRTTRPMQTTGPILPATFSFVSKGDEYNIVSSEKAYADKKAALFKLLQVGEYRFAIVLPDNKYTPGSPVKGELVRYVVLKDKLQICTIRPDPLKIFLQEKYPHTQDVIVHACDRKDSKKFCWNHLQITQLNDETAAMLATIPDGKDHWDCQEVAERLQASDR